MGKRGLVSGGGVDDFYNLSNIPSIFRVVYNTTYLDHGTQWAVEATASSQYSSSGWSANQMIGQPNTGLAVGANGGDQNKAWAPSATNRQSINTITLTYLKKLYIDIVTVRETLKSGTISKLEVSKEGVFETVYTRNLTTGVQTGGSITGENAGKVTDTKITLTNQLDYPSNKIRITLGNNVNQYNEIDAVLLAGFAVKSVVPVRVNISYEDLIDKQEPELVSTTDYANITAALADTKVSTANAGDWVRIAGKLYHIIADNPNASDIIQNDKQVESKIVSTTDFANVGAALNDDSVKDARSGDWVKITGIFNIITKSNPTATTDFISLNAITTWESITGKPSEITDAQVTSGVGTDPVLVTPAKAKAMIEAHSTSDSGVNSYIDLENRPDDVISTTIVPATTTGGEFTPNNDNDNKALVNITDNGKTLTTIRSNNAWGGSGTFSTESINGDGYVSFKRVVTNKRFMFGLSRAADAPSTTYGSIDFAIYIDVVTLQIYENSHFRASYPSSLIDGATYKVKRVGNTITYLVNDVVFHTSATTSTVPLHMDTAFFSAGGKIDEVTMLNAPATSVPRTATYKIDYRNNNLINKPTIPTLPAEITDAQVTSGVGTDEVLMTTTKLKTAIVAHSTPLPTRVTTTEKNARNGTTIRSWTVKDIADMDTGGGGATLPPEITDTQVTSGAGTTTVLVTPAKAKAMIEAHAPAGVETFETILNNHRSWNIRRIYSDAGVLTNIGFRKTIDGTEKRIIVTYSYNTNGSINNIDLVGELPASVDTRKHHSYDDAGRISEITYSTPTP